ncbi:restriction endonuclease subunit S [Vibrio campbellii]|uniref:restriction endonuclease subunit S n=1 Tax=Vibrio campbellii TaxID=680 RepID=UPI000CD379D7|nr:restriction endonuclease subunit S [Vibrio campbellii]AUW02645.1 hypothetical protein C1N51_02050 [Vibrio campbellii]
MVPSGWEIKTVGDLFEVQLGKMLNKAAKETFPQYPYLGNSDVRWGYFNLSNLKLMYFNEREMEKFTLEDGDVLMCEGGEVGRCAIWNGGNTQIFYQKALHRLRGKGDIVPKYFQFYMSLINGTKLLDDFSTKTSIAHLTREKLLELPVKTPPYSEQRKISKLLSAWDKAISTTEKLIETSKQQKKALMQQLLTGKKRLINPETGKVFQETWEEVRVQDIVQSLDAGVSVNSEDDGGTSSNYKVLKTSCVSRGIFESTEAKSVKEENEIARLKEPVLSDSIIISRMNTPVLVGANAYIKSAPNGTFLPDRLWQIKTKKSEVHTRWLGYWFASEHTRYSLRANATGTSGSMKNITKPDVLSMKVYCPPYVEQQKIASVLTVADKEIEVLGIKLAHFKQEKKALMQQLLTGKRRVVVEAA